MVVGSLAKAGLVAGREVKRVLDFPVVGVRKKVVRQTKRRTIETDYSFQLRGWEVGILAIGAGMVLAYTKGDIMKLINLYVPGSAERVKAEKEIEWLQGPQKPLWDALTKDWIAENLRILARGSP